MNSEEQGIIDRTLVAVSAAFGVLPDKVPDREPWFTPRLYPVTVAALRGVCYQVYRTAMTEAIEVARVRKYYPLAFSVRPLLETSLRVLWSTQASGRDYAIVRDLSESREREERISADDSSSSPTGSGREELDRFVGNFDFAGSQKKAPNMRTVIENIAVHDRGGGYVLTLFWDADGDGSLDVYFQQQFKPLNEMLHMVPTTMFAAVSDGKSWSRRFEGYVTFLRGLHESIYCWRRAFGPDDVESHAAMASEHWCSYAEANNIE